PRLELRMELRRDEPRVVRQLDDLDEAAFLVGAADDEAAGEERLPVGIVDLVAVPVALEDDRLVRVQLTRPRSLDELDRLRAEPHRPAQVLDLLLLRQQVDDGVRRLRVHLRRVGTVETADVTGELRHGDMHAEADAEVRDRVLARDAKPPGTSTPSTSASSARASASDMCSASTQRTRTFAPVAIPAWRSASCTDR